MFTNVSCSLSAEYKCNDSGKDCLRCVPFLGESSVWDGGGFCFRLHCPVYAAAIFSEHYEIDSCQERFFIKAFFFCSIQPTIMQQSTIKCNGCSVLWGPLKYFKSTRRDFPKLSAITIWRSTLKKTKTSSTNSLMPIPKSYFIVLPIANHWFLCRLTLGHKHPHAGFNSS